MSNAGRRAVVRTAPFTSSGLKGLASGKQEAIERGELTSDFNKSDAELIYNFPTVYVINSNKRIRGEKKYHVYVGETSDILQRTGGHLVKPREGDEDWEELKNASNSMIYVLGHSYFNKP
ncbi:GIY-YIG nuclease family protein [Corynebacterium resistens]|nr:hypothetical protein [Corynebacterium resistens]